LELRQDKTRQYLNLVLLLIKVNVLSVITYDENSYSNRHRLTVTATLSIYKINNINMNNYNK